jgi:hypothetical protein
MSDLLPYRRKAGAIEDPAADFANQLLKCPIVNGSLLSYTTDGTTNRQQVRHGLGRAFRGAFVTGASSATSTHRLHVLTPNAAQLLGVDVTQYMSVVPAIASADTFTMWVF